MPHDRVEAVERALTVLECFSEETKTLTLAEFASKTGFYKSTILRLSRSLERFGYLRKLDDGAYKLGPSLWRLGALYRQDYDLGKNIRPVLTTLRDATGETASFYVMEGDKRICLYRENSNRAIRHHLDEGAQLPLNQGAAGKLLSTFAGIKNGTEANQIKQQEFAVSRGERDPDVAAVAVPLFSKDGSVKGALCVSGLVHRFEDEFIDRCIATIKEEALNLTALLDS